LLLLLLLLLLLAGKQTVNTMFGTRVAVLAGDFLFAQASWLIANLENLEVGAQHCMVCNSAAAAAVAPGCS
jgi:geranylgeranyl pyrophosphate synthase